MHCGSVGRRLQSSTTGSRSATRKPTGFSVRRPFLQLGSRGATSIRRCPTWRPGQHTAPGAGPFTRECRALHVIRRKRECPAPWCTGVASTRPPSWSVYDARVRTARRPVGEVVHARRLRVPGAEFRGLVGYPLGPASCSSPAPRVHCIQSSCLRRSGVAKTALLNALLGLDQGSAPAPPPLFRVAGELVRGGKGASST